MDKTLQIPTKIPYVDAENNAQNTQPLTCNSGKIGTPDRLKVPKAFKYPERYTSPTDQIMSPVTRGILARSRKGSKLLPPSAAKQPKIQAIHLQELDMFKVDKC
ncbi:hypothetical protein DH2020_037118 [Rehmannia glutinosa]|uniref:Uncharacterized protein n=1 Tax=Rehmannia glutinosa TaxID=99300 RepID=A0ABR0V2A6_REHGL